MSRFLGSSRLDGSSSHFPLKEMGETPTESFTSPVSVRSLDTEGLGFFGAKAYKEGLCALGVSIPVGLEK
ncbi:MAG: hypothetical protein GY705_30020 [Bacteroidetes bacterium]|nr:hypothetical protein [Bacteroidota bacterium]